MNPWEIAELAARLLGENLGQPACVEVVGAERGGDGCEFRLRVRPAPRMLVEGERAPAGSVPQA